MLSQFRDQEDLLVKVFLRRNDKYLFLGHRAIINFDEAPEEDRLTVKFAPAKDDLSVYHLEDNRGLIEQGKSQVVALPFEMPEAIPDDVIKNIEKDYKPGKGNRRLFLDRYKYNLLEFERGNISYNDFLKWLGGEKSNVPQADYEEILSKLVLKNVFENSHQLLEIAFLCVNNESSLEFCNDFLNFIINNIKDSDFKYKTIPFVDVMLLNNEKLEQKHYKKIAKAYAQIGELNSAVKYYASAFKDDISANDLDCEFRRSLYGCNYTEVEGYIEELLNAGLLVAFEIKIPESEDAERFDLVTKFYDFYKDKIKPDQEKLEAFASSVLSIFSENNEWEYFEVFYDDIENREKFMKKTDKKFDLLSIGEISSDIEFIGKLSGKYFGLFKKYFRLIASPLKKELLQQIRIFLSMMEIPDTELSNWNWLDSINKESEAEIKEKVRTDDLLNICKNIFIIGGRDTTRKTIEKKLLNCGAENVRGEPPMFEKTLNKKSLLKKLDGYNCVVFLTNYMGHAEYYMGKDIASRKDIRIVHCSGGISRLLVELGKLKKKGD